MDSDNPPKIAGRIVARAKPFGAHSAGIASVWVEGEPHSPAMIYWGLANKSVL